MSHAQSFVMWAVLAAAATSAVSAPQDGAKPATTPATEPATVMVPKAVLDEIASQITSPTATLPTKEKIRRNTRAMELANQAAADYPTADNRHVALYQSLMAAHALVNLKSDAASQETLIEVARGLLDSDAPPEARVQADFFVMRWKVVRDKTPGKKVKTEIRAFVGRYEKTASAASAIVYALQLARQMNQTRLTDELVDLLEARHLEIPGVRGFLRDNFGRHPDIGKPFNATLTRLDGAKLALPGDLLGKVVIIDFWATWCPPCRASVPHMREIYARYKSQGLEIVGISLDDHRQALADYVAKEKLEWIHAFSGMRWDDPTVRRYGISSVPSVWIVGRDGKVISDQALPPTAANLKAGLDNVERLVRRALAQPAPKDSQEKQR